MMLSIAKNFPDCQFLGIDYSENSLRIAHSNARKLNLKNVTFKNMNIMEDLSELGKFGIVICTGVLHHIKDLNHAFNQIIQLLDQNGYVILWFYGYYGRFRHNLNQSFLRILMKKMNKSEMVSVAKDFLENLDHKFVINSGFYTPKGSGEEGIAWLLKHSQWLADQMIPDYEKPVTIKEIMNLFNECRIEFVKWFGVPIDLKSYTSSKILLKCFEALSFKEKLLAIDCLIKPDYYFIAGKRNQ